MASTYDKMTLAELRKLADQRINGLMQELSTGAPMAEEPPPEPPVTDLPLSAARAQAARNAANSQGM